MPSDEEIIDHLRMLATANKSLAVKGIWQEREINNYIRLNYVSALSIDDVIVSGLSIIGRARKNAPDQDLTFVILARHLGVDHLLGRLDWRPKRPHTNKVGPLEFLGSFAGSQWHSFEENATLGLEALRQGNLPFAKSINPDPDTYNDVLEFLRYNLIVENAPEIPIPPWEEQGEFEL